MNARGTEHRGTEPCMLWHPMDETPYPDQWCFILTRHERRDGTVGYQVMHDNFADEAARQLRMEPGFCRRNVAHIIGWMPDPECPRSLAKLPPFWTEAPSVPDRQSWCHVLCLSRGKLVMRNDLYAVELARAYGDPAGFVLDRVHAGELPFVRAWLPWPGLPHPSVIGELERLDRARGAKR